MYQRTNFPKNRDRYPRTLREAFGPAATWRVAHHMSDRPAANDAKPPIFARPFVLGILWALLVLAAMAGVR